MERALRLTDDLFDGIEICAFPSPRTPLHRNRMRRDLTFCEALHSADLALVSGGLTLFDSVYAGVPTVVWCQYAHQVRNAALFRSSVLSAGMADADRTVRILVKKMAEDFPLRQRMSRRCFAALDDQGYQRVYEIINHLVHTGA